MYSLLVRGIDRFHGLLLMGHTLLLVLAVVLAYGGVPLGWCLLVVTASPFVTVIGYETVGHKHVAADVERTSETVAA